MKTARQQKHLHLDQLLRLRPREGHVLGEADDPVESAGDGNQPGDDVNRRVGIERNAGHQIAGQRRIDDPVLSPHHLARPVHSMRLDGAAQSLRPVCGTIRVIAVPGPAHEKDGEREPIRRRKH